MYFILIACIAYIYLDCEESEADGTEPEESDPNAGRFVRYQFTPQFLKLRTVGAT